MRISFTTWRETGFLAAIWIKVISQFHICSVGMGLPAALCWVLGGTRGQLELVLVEKAIWLVGRGHTVYRPRDYCW